MTLDQETQGVSGNGGYTTPNVFGSGKGRLLLRRLVQRRFEHNVFTSGCNYEPVGVGLSTPSINGATVDAEGRSPATCIATAIAPPR